MQAKDLGIQGHTFTIEEPDLLQMLQGKLQLLEKEGRIAHHQQELLARTRQKLMRPDPVKGLTRTTVYRSWTYDPSLTVARDLKDHKGRVFHKAGTRINPLHFRNLNQPLVFFDGDDPDQVAWIEKQFIQGPTRARLVLVKGAPFELMEKWDCALYFDQQGILTHKFGIEHVPAQIRQQQQVLLVEELQVDSPQQHGKE